VAEKIHVIPYIDQPGPFWDNLFNNYSSFIKEVYFPVQSDFIGTGRPVQPAKYLNDFLRNDAIPKSILINPVILPRPVNEIKEVILEYLTDMVENYNIVGVSVVNPSLAGIIKSEFPSLEITASTLMDISTVQQVIMLRANVDAIVPSGRIIRDIGQMQEIRASFHGKIRLLVNESCLPSCLYRTQHFYEMSDFSNKHPESLCIDQLARFPWMRLTGSWILPQHLHFFDGLYDEIKLAGRVTLSNPADYLEIMENYFLKRTIGIKKIGGGPASIPYGINITNEFYEHTLHCNKNCDECSICMDYWIANT
jgi:hypothetical protein